MSTLFNTSTKKEVVRRWPLYALVAAALVALILVVEAIIRVESFTPGREEIVSPTIQDVAVSTRDELYPPPDTSRFEGQPTSVFVYLSVEGLPAGEDMEARVQRAGSGSAFSLLLGGEEIEALDEQEDHLSNTENGATGVVKFALGTHSGDPVPPGNYTLDVLYDPESDAALAARKLFVVEE
jgi:hypothetical protein